MTDAANPAVPATRRTMRELVDGTIRVQLDIDPLHRKAFLDQFSAIDMPVAIVPLKADFERSEPKLAVGPRCLLAVQWCKDPAFQEWIGEKLGVEKDEGGARDAILRLCVVGSRRTLDDISDAGDTFDQLIRYPYQRHLRSQHGSDAAG